jgi:hypothetical protein
MRASREKMESEARCLGIGAATIVLVLAPLAGHC